ncbi:saccharopine dehydrogenase [Hamadaea tsunoensis]|uniref:saccharopine dehydrogenase n=1 Tax=Hamadaea tsunoensis TaxID=53368 RepID=UPI0003F5C5C3|nr:saccharopine dehydrogenase [Hamadaea tsunoensis]
MSQQPRLWVRHETRPTERRAPVVPDDARRLVGKGFAVTVEESAQRAFPISAYADAGCRIVPAGSWADAGRDEIIVGLKELPDTPDALVHRHVFFGHAYKGQDGAAALLGRFAAGGGTLLDMEYLVDDAGRRLAAFGYWAGYVGAALAVLQSRGELTVPLAPRSQAELDAELARGAAGPQPRVLVIGALGRCGQGARAALEVAGITPTGWDVAETRDLDKAALLAHDVLVNTVLTTRPVPPFVTPEDLDTGPRLSLICDVTCDVTSALNVLPIYTSVTSWPEPVRRLREGVDLIAIDNLPSLLPAEASVAFSGELTEQLLSLGNPVWDRCEAVYRKAQNAQM